MKFEEKYFRELNFTAGQIKKYFDNALKDIHIAKQDDFREVRFNYTYTAFIRNRNSHTPGILCAGL